MKKSSIALIAIGGGLLLAYNLYQIFMVLPDDVHARPHLPDHVLSRSGRHCRHDGLFRRTHVQRSCIWSTNNLRWDSLAASVVEVSVVFSVVNIVTGSIWARVIWGIWWTWDYRLTSALVCVLIFSGLFDDAPCH